MLKYMLIAVSILFICACGTPMPGSYDIAGLYKPVEKNNEFATIYFFNRVSMVQAPCYVTENDIRIGVMKSGTYFVHQVLPGQYTYAATNDNFVNPSLYLNTEAGQEYYVEVAQVSDFLTAHTSIVLSSKEQAQAYLPSLKLIIYRDK